MDLGTYSVEQLQCSNSPPHGIIVVDAVEGEKPEDTVPWTEQCLDFSPITASKLELQPGMKLVWAEAVEFKGVCCVPFKLFE